MREGGNREVRRVVDELKIAAENSDDTEPHLGDDSEPLPHWNEYADDAVIRTTEIVAKGVGNLPVGPGATNVASDIEAGPTKRR
jgi:hypothetical protein